MHGRDMIAGSKELIRDINTGLVLSTILNTGSISRASLAKKIGLTKATISAIVQPLIDKNLLIEIGSDDTSRGRKPILLTVNEAYGDIISIDLTHDYITIMTCNIKCKNCRLVQYVNRKDSNSVVNYLISLIEETIEKLNSNLIIGISIGIHGIVYNNSIVFTPYSPYTGIDFADALSKRFHMPIYLENEANLSIIGERALCYDYPNMIGISVHSGVGLGVIIDNRLYTGANGYSGEFGHSIIELNGRPCPCGNRGCFEQYASEQVLLRDFTSTSHFLASYRNNDSRAIAAVDDFVKYMTIGINNILNMYNPDLIVINSVFTVNISGLTDRITSNITGRMHPYCKVVASTLQDTSILMGGACKVVTKYLNVADDAINFMIK